MNLPFVTIGIPVYNEDKFVAETILSALNQTYKNIRIIISDNCSTDRTFEIAAKYAQVDGRIKLIRHEKNIGASMNFELLLRNADGKYFMWLGGHDLISKNYLADAVDLLERNMDLSLVYFNHQFIDENGKDIETPVLSDINSTKLNKEGRLLKVVTDLQWCTSFHGVFRQEFNNNIPFVKCVGPDHLILFALANHGKIKYIAEIAYFRREFRKQETDEVRFERYKSYGIDTKNNYSDLVFEHLKYTFENVEFSSGIKRILFFIKLRLAFKYLVDASWEDLKELAKSNLNNKKFIRLLTTCGLVTKMGLSNFLTGNK